MSNSNDSPKPEKLPTLRALDWTETPFSFEPLANPLVGELQSHLGEKSVDEIEKQDLRSVFRLLRSIDKKVDAAIATFPELDDANAVLLFGDFSSMFSTIQGANTRVWLAYIWKLWGITSGFCTLERCSEFVICLAREPSKEKSTPAWDWSFNKVEPLWNEMRSFRQESMALADASGEQQISLMDSTAHELRVRKLVARADACSVLAGEGKQVKCDWQRLVWAVVGENSLARRWYNYKVDSHRQKEKSRPTPSSNLEAKDLYWAKRKQEEQQNSYSSYEPQSDRFECERCSGSGKSPSRPDGSASHGCCPACGRKW